jgi:phage recombination protein Bet
MFWMNDDERSTEDCPELIKFKAMCLEAMFPKGGEPSNDAPESAADQSVEGEQQREESTNEPVWEQPTHQSFVPAPAPRRQVAVANHQYTRDQINTIRNTVAKGADDNELAMFLHISETYGLDPFLKEIFYSAQMKTIITSRDGYLKVAQRDPDFDGIQSMAVCENDDFSIDMEQNKVNHVFGKGGRGKVIGAWAICYRKGRRPVIAYADYDEYNKKNNIWNTYKSAMCCKVAEGFSLKRQFGISGLATEEEMGVKA